MGVVQKIALSADLSRVVVTVRMNKEAAPLLTDKARFWVVRPRFFAGSISGLSTLFSGSYIDLLPSGEGGEPQTDFVGLENPPVLQSDVPGRTFLLDASRIGSLNLGSPIMFRDLEAGEILGWDVDEMARNITIHAFVRAPFDKYVHDNSRFWNASGATVQLGANGLQFQVESLRAIVLGGIAFDTPDDPKITGESEPNRAFTLYPNKEAADASVFKRSVPFVANFTTSVSGLAAGSPVMLRGLKIGEVSSVSLVYDRAADTVVVPVHFTLEPERIAMLDLPTDGDLDSRMRELIHRGLRVKLESGSILTGQKQLVMDIFPGAVPAELRKDGGDYVVPVLGGGADDVATAATNLVNRLNSIPFETIGQNLNQTLAGVNGLVNDKQLGQSIAALRATLASTRELVDNLNRGVDAGGQAVAGDFRRVGGGGEPHQQADWLGGDRIWWRFAVQPRCRSPDDAAFRRLALDPRAGGSAVAPPGGADPRPHRPGASVMLSRRAALLVLAGIAGGVFVAQPGAVCAGPGARCRGGQRAANHRRAADIAGAIPGAVADRAVFRRLPDGRAGE